MKEVEAKILEIDVEKVQKQLKNLGAKKVFDADMPTYWFDFEDNSLKKKGQLLRLRKKGDETELTFKEKISKKDVKIMEEIESLICDGEKFKQILEAVGFKVAGYFTKHRISYKLEGFSFELDTFENIPTYLEIEGLSEEKIFEMAQKLGFKKSDLKPWTGKDVLEYYKQKI